MIYVDETILPTKGNIKRDYITQSDIISITIFNHILMYFIFSSTSPDEESGFPHRKVTLKRQRDVRAQYEMLDEIGR